MNDTEKTVNALQALTAENKNRSKTARLRDLLPQIEASQAAGVTHKKILETLNQQGLDLKPKAYSVILWRLRAQLAQEKPTVPAPGPVMSMPVTAIRKIESDTKQKSTIPEKKPGDPESFAWDSENNKPPDW